MAVQVSQGFAAERLVSDGSVVEREAVVKGHDVTVGDRCAHLREA